MDYGQIGKREKAKRYAEDHNRFSLNEFEITFRHKNEKHRISFKGGEFSCDCDFFSTHQRCEHTMALEILLQGMIFEDAELVGEIAIAGSITLEARIEHPATSVKSSHRERPEIHTTKPRQAEESSGPQISKTSENEIKRQDDETQEFSIQSDLSTSVLQEALSPYLEALTELQQVIDEFKGRESSPVKILGITSHD